MKQKNGEREKKNNEKQANRNRQGNEMKLVTMEADF